MILWFFVGHWPKFYQYSWFLQHICNKILKYCNFCHNIWQIKNRLKINIKMNAAICVELSHIVIWIESPTQISRILFFSSCLLLKHWVCKEAWHSVMKLQHFMESRWWRRLSSQQLRYLQTRKWWQAIWIYFRQKTLT